MLEYPLNITIDSNIFIENRFDFRKDSTLKLLSSFVNDGKIKVILSDVVIRESEKHIEELGRELCKIYNNCRSESLKISNDEFIKKLGLEYLLKKHNKKDVMTLARNEFKDYIESLNCEILNSDNINLSTILDAYFSLTPPFGPAKEKRKEFPDAIIVEQIKKRFDNEIVAIITNDNLFIKSFEEKTNYMFFRSLGELFDKINQDNIDYENACKTVNSIKDELLNRICNSLIFADYLDVIGLSYDRDGIEYGFDYTDFEVQEVSTLDYEINTIDEIAEARILATLYFKGEIEVICSYDDYNTAIWDSELKEYTYIETKNVLERHRFKFGCRIEVDKATKEFNIKPYRLILNSDTRKERKELEEDLSDLESDIMDQDRNELGFQSLDKYNDYLEQDFIESKTNSYILSLFECMNSIYNEYEEISSAYDLIHDLHEKDKNGFKEKVLLLISQLAENEVYVDELKDIVEFREVDIEKVLEWADTNFERLSNIASYNLPDDFNYGDTITFYNTKNLEYHLTLEELQNEVSIGNVEWINIELSLNNIVVARGYIELTVGYLNFNDDGNADTGVCDSIEYYCDEIISKLNEIVIEMENDLDREKQISRIIESIFDE